jgi:hypothetical protein
VYQSKLVGLLIAEVKQSNAINKEVGSFKNKVCFDFLLVNICYRIKEFWMDECIQTAL